MDNLAARYTIDNCNIVDLILYSEWNNLELKFVAMSVYHKLDEKYKKNYCIHILSRISNLNLIFFDRKEIEAINDGKRKYKDYNQYC